MAASSVSDPTRVASTTSRPPALTVAPMTVEPGATSTGIGSPVSMLASTADDTFADDAVRGDLLAGTHHEHVTHVQPVDGDPGLDTVAQHAGVVRAQREQGPECLS